MFATQTVLLQVVTRGDRRVQASSLYLAREVLAGRSREGRRSAAGLETAERRLTAVFFPRRS